MFVVRPETLAMFSCLLARGRRAAADYLSGAVCGDSPRHFPQSLGRQSLIQSSGNDGRRGETIFRFVIMGLITGGLALLGFVTGLVLGGGFGAVVGLFVGLVAGETISLTVACVLARGWWPSPSGTEPVNDRNTS